MINHPMLLMRDPPPEIDVTRPALSKHSHVDSFVFVVSTPTTIEFTTVMAPVAADQFKAGDRVMWHHVCGSQKWLRGIYSAAYSSNIVSRRPTAAELALHWPEVLP